ncbi:MULTISPECIES: PIN-like domain-containing protein, partial [unclassified Frankia]|uniref:PIN-like domain-containing protein n=1 Tax=unclassified Frankia TaxID=2632575 RepID=UPI002AD4C4FD
RLTADARDDLLAVLERLADVLWVPHQVVTEYWRNRESVLRDPRDTDKTIRELKDHREKAVRSFRTWVNRVSLSSDRTTNLLGALNTGFDAVTAGVAEFTDASAADSARNTNADPVILRLREILRNRVGIPLDGKSHAAAVAEGLRRVEMRQPPGYKDRKKGDEGAAGDYLVWEQVLVEAARRGRDVLFVTGDIKEDWWREEAGERRGPRLELVNEMRCRAGVRLFMLRPADLLEYAQEVLQVAVREESVRDADRVDKFLSEPPLGGGWGRESLDELLAVLSGEAPVQAAVIRLAVRQDGFIGRDQVYALGDYPPDRSLRGFTRPINRVVQQFRDEGLVHEDAVYILRTDYERPSALGLAAGFRIHEDVLPLLSALLRRDADSSISGDD